jgi:hypothetical protein
VDKIAVVSGLERKPGGIIRVRAKFLDAVLEGKLDGNSVELNRPAAPSTKWCVLQ